MSNIGTLRKHVIGIEACRRNLLSRDNRASPRPTGGRAASDYRGYKRNKAFGRGIAKNMGKSKLSPRLLEDVERFVTDEPETARQIHDRLDTWARTSIRKALAQLVEEGRIVREGEPEFYRYRRHR